MELRDYQKEAVKNGIQILSDYRLLILNYEVRTGKTAIALSISDILGDKILFITKKKAISSIEKDCKSLNIGKEIMITNYEQLHKIPHHYFDFVICDECHSLGAFPKMNNRQKEVLRICRNSKYVILMTGTLLPESNAQIFHQLFCTGKSPFNHANFYKWHNDFGIKGIVYTSYGEAIDYKNVPYDKIKTYFEHLVLTYTQKEAGFKSEIKEHFITVEMKESTYNVIKRLKKDLVIISGDREVLADTGVKLMSKLHQMYSGTVKTEKGEGIVFDTSKAEKISQLFKGKKIAIFYKFVAELDAIKQYLDITSNIEEFNTTDKNIALQIVSGREGINLSKAEAIVYYNIDFSAVSYWQSRDRMTTIDREISHVYWCFAKNGIEWAIYKAVSNKKDFVLQTFKKWQASTNKE